MMASIKMQTGNNGDTAVVVTEEGAVYANWYDNRNRPESNEVQYEVRTALETQGRLSLGSGSVGAGITPQYNQADFRAQYWGEISDEMMEKVRETFVLQEDWSPSWA